MAEDVHIIGDDFKEAFGGLLKLVPKAKRAEAFQPAAFCEVAYNEARRLLRGSLPHVPEGSKDELGRDLRAAIKSMIGE